LLGSGKMKGAAAEEQSAGLASQLASLFLKRGTNSAVTWTQVDHPPIVRGVICSRKHGDRTNVVDTL
jgi:hypothetical protein